MDREVYIVVAGEDIPVGRVNELLDDCRQDKLELAMRDILEGLVFDTESKDYAVVTIELR